MQQLHRPQLLGYANTVRCTNIKFIVQAAVRTIRGPYLVPTFILIADPIMLRLYAPRTWSVWAMATWAMGHDGPAARRSAPRLLHAYADGGLHAARRGARLLEHAGCLAA
eukprot:SAG31_NODE_28255_length_413_cov_0.646497_1_plen_109_part_10